MYTIIREEGMVLISWDLMLRIRGGRVLGLLVLVSRRGVRGGPVLR